MIVSIPPTSIPLKRKLRRPGTLSHLPKRRVLPRVGDVAGVICERNGITLAVIMVMPRRIPRHTTFLNNQPLPESQLTRILPWRG